MIDEENVGEREKQAGRIIRWKGLGHDGSSILSPRSWRTAMVTLLDQCNVGKLQRFVTSSITRPAQW